MPPSVRPYRPEDRAAVALVFFRAVREGSVAHYSQAEREAWAPSPDPDWHEPDKFLDQWCFVAEKDGQITGFMSMDKTGYLDCAFVIPEVMGNGTAAALYDRMMDAARAAGLRRFTVKAVENSRRFLARRDWQVDGMEKGEERGHVYEVHLMSLTLEAPR